MPRHSKRLSGTVIVKVQKPTNFDKEFSMITEHIKKT